MNRYNVTHAEPLKRFIRNETSLKEHFNRLVKSKKPTGDPNCPEAVKRAKWLNRQIHNILEAGEIAPDDFDCIEEFDDGADFADGLSELEPEYVEGTPFYTVSRSSD